MKSAVVVLSSLLALGGSLHAATTVEATAVVADEVRVFDPDALTSRPTWTDSRPSPGTYDGRVLVVLLAADASPRTMLAAPTMARLHGRFADQGLDAVIVHTESGWDQIEDRAARGRIRVPVARDDDGAVAKALGVAPGTVGLFVVDRAGQVRDAGLDSRDLAGRVSRLLRESPEEAVEHARAEAAGQTLDLPELDPAKNDTDDRDAERPQVSPEDYAKAAWPDHNRSRISARNVQGKPLPVKLGKERWLTERRDLDDKVIVLDFWATWCGPCHAAAPNIEEALEEHDGKVEVLAISGMNDPIGTVKRFIRRSGHSFSYLHDDKETLSNALNVRGIPHTAILSTDGIVRWQGHPGTREFRRALTKVVEADPLLKTRAEARRTERSEQESHLGWPAHNTGTLHAAKDVQGDELKDALDGLTWLTGRPDVGGKVVVVDFWATWCGPCLKLSPRLAALQEKYPDDLVVVAVSGQGAGRSHPETERIIELHLRKNPPKYTYAHDDDQRLYKRLGVSGIPHALVLSSDGVVRWQGFPGPAPFEDIVAAVIEADKNRKGEG